MAAMTHVMKLMWKAAAVDQIIQTCLRELTNDSTEPMFWENLNRARIAKRNTHVPVDARYTQVWM